MTISKSEEIKQLLSKSRASFEAGNTLFESEHYDFAVSRYYYSMFYLATALLLTKNINCSKHSGVISNFGKEFIKAGIIDKKYHHYLISAFDDRIDADYSVMEEITKEMAEETRKNAEEFILEIQRYIIAK